MLKTPEEKQPVTTRRTSRAQVGAAVAPSLEDLISAMEPGRRYGLKQIANRLKTTTAVAERLVGSGLKQSKLRQSQARNLSRYWLPTPAELESDRRHQERATFSAGSLQGYDSTHQEFRNLCMLARR